MATTLFIGEQYLRQYTVLSANLDVNLIVPNIEYAQDAYTQNILGSKFYNTLQNDYAVSFTGGTPMSSGETTLIMLIKPALAYRAIQSSVKLIYSQIRAKGFNHLKSEDATPSMYNEVKDLEAMFKDRAELYEKKVLTYLWQNGNQFADYLLPDNPLYPQKETSFECDLYTGKANRNNSNVWDGYYSGSFDPYNNGSLYW